VTNESQEDVKEKLEKVIEQCKLIEDGLLQPFSINVEDLILVLRKCFPECKTLEERQIDSEALYRVSSVIAIQSEWVKRRTTSMYRDPFLLEEKIKNLNGEKILSIFLKCWRPIIFVEQITENSLKKALEYWKGLPPIKERTPKIVEERDVFRGAKWITEKFMKELNEIRIEFNEKIKKYSGKIKYWDFISVDSYSETIKRAYLMSFLITYGHVKIELQEDEIFLVPGEDKKENIRARKTSLPIPVSFEYWVRWKRGEK